MRSNLCHPEKLSDRLLCSPLGLAVPGQCHCPSSMQCSCVPCKPDDPLLYFRYSDCNVISAYSDDDEDCTCVKSCRHCLGQKPPYIHSTMCQPHCGRPDHIQMSCSSTPNAAEWKRFNALKRQWAHKKNRTKDHSFVSSTSCQLSKQNHSDLQKHGAPAADEVCAQVLGIPTHVGNTRPILDPDSWRVARVMTSVGTFYPECCDPAVSGNLDVNFGVQYCGPSTSRPQLLRSNEFDTSSRKTHFAVPYRDSNAKSHTLYRRPTPFNHHYDSDVLSNGKDAMYGAGIEYIDDSQAPLRVDDHSQLGLQGYELSQASDISRSSFGKQYSGDADSGMASYVSGRSRLSNNASSGRNHGSPSHIGSYADEQSPFPSSISSYQQSGQSYYEEPDSASQIRSILDERGSHRGSHVSKSEHSQRGSELVHSGESESAHTRRGSDISKYSRSRSIHSEAKHSHQGSGSSDSSSAHSRRGSDASRHSRSRSIHSEAKHSHKGSGSSDSGSAHTRRGSDASRHSRSRSIHSEEKHSHRGSGSSDSGSAHTRRGSDASRHSRSRSIHSEEKHSHQASGSSHSADYGGRSESSSSTHSGSGESSSTYSDRRGSAASQDTHSRHGSEKHSQKGPTASYHGSEKSARDHSSIRSGSVHSDKTKRSHLSHSHRWDDGQSLKSKSHHSRKTLKREPSTHTAHSDAKSRRSQKNYKGDQSVYSKHIDTQSYHFKNLKGEPKIAKPGKSYVSFHPMHDTDKHSRKTWKGGKTKSTKSGKSYPSVYTAHTTGTGKNFSRESTDSESSVSSDGDDRTDNQGSGSYSNNYSTQDGTLKTRHPPSSIVTVLKLSEHLQSKEFNEPQSLKSKQKTSKTTHKSHKSHKSRH